MPSTDRLDRAARFVWHTARVLEQRLFRHHFHAPDPDGVRAALAGYATADGGYGFALEPDGRGPSSQPLHVDFALGVLAEIGRLDAETVAPALGYLAGISRPDDGLPAVHAGIRDHPRAPWWVVDEGSTGSLLPTTHIVGLLSRNGIRHPWLDRAVDFCWAGTEALTAKTHPYELIGCVAFLDAMRDKDSDRARRAADRLGEIATANRMVLCDPDHPERTTLADGYAPGEYHLPHDFAPTPDSLARQWFSDADFERGLDFLAASQQDDGGWRVPYLNWNPVAHQEWNGIATVRALLTLRTFGR